MRVAVTGISAPAVSVRLAGGLWRLLETTKAP
jgi:hypothetical protein